jgi:hypothetical protein
MLKIVKAGYGCGCSNSYTIPALPNLNTGNKRQVRQGIKALALVKCDAYGALDTDAKIADSTVWTALIASNDAVIISLCEANTSFTDDTSFELRGGCGAYSHGAPESTLTIEDDTDNAALDRTKFYQTLNDNTNGFFVLANFCGDANVGNLSGLYRCAVDAKHQLDTDGRRFWTITFKVQGAVMPKYTGLTWDLTTL